MPFEKKIDHIAKGRALFIPNQDWEVLLKWSSYEKGEAIFE